MRFIGSSIIVLAALSQVGADDCGGPPVIRDDGFDLWCGDQLCAWKVERGEIKRVATWNEGDAGVELIGSDVALEQLSPFDSGDGTCIRFSLIANVEDTAEVYLNVDVQGDGTLEMEERLPTSHWKPLSYLIALKSPYDGLRFELTKRGAGKAVLAKIGAKRASGECSGLTELDPGPRRNGAACFMGTDCASGLCKASPTGDYGQYLDFVCVACDATNACANGNVCGLGDPFSPLFAEPTACVAPASKELGENCIDNAECASNICYRGTATVGACSSCSTDAECPTDQRCVTSGSQARVCGGAASGAPCAANSDCASGTCNGGVRMECDVDGRPCSSPADCPFEALQNTACVSVGIQGGSCQ